MAKPSPSGSRPKRYVGPVADLESHLPPEWWRELFDSVYLQTDGDVVENDANTAREVDLLICATGITPKERVLDLCCGQGRHSIELARRGFGHVVGVDRSSYLVRLARRRAAKSGLPVAFHSGDARSFRKAGDFDLVALMGNSFGYFDTEEDDVRVLETVKRALISGGALALDLTDGDWMRDNFERRSWEWIDQNHFVCRERSLSADRDRLISREVVVHAERGVIADQFYAERLYSFERIGKLLGKVGFRDVRLHEALGAESDRNQDLGMMAHRIFLSAMAPRKSAVKPAGGRGIVPVTVLLGDPRLPDPVKKGGLFGAEDFATIDKLKNALAECKGFTFDYLDNHASMLAELKAKQPALVFNLCDEGFNNDAFKEMHVPAYLDMLGIPYTGSGPAALALCYDKGLVRAVAQALDVPVPLETHVRPGESSATMPSTFPALLKPGFGDSSIGITKEAVVRSPQELLAYLQHLRETLPGRPVLVQEFLTGAEYGIALIGNPENNLRALPILEVDFSGLDPGLPHILGYESKWDPASPYWTQIRYRETGLDAETQRVLIERSRRLFERLGCRDYARFDFRTDSSGTIKLLEVNPNPGWCWDGKFNLMAGFDGLRYPELLRLILEAAVERLAATAQPTAVESAAA